MQQLKLYKRMFRYSSMIEDKEYSPKVYERKKILDDYEKLRQEGISQEVIFSVLNISRATYYRWKERYRLHKLDGLEPINTTPQTVRKSQWSKELENNVLIIRKKYSLFGKSKINAILKREYNIKTSVSTVGRILSHLYKRRLIQPVSFYTGKYEPKRRIFNNHAQRLPKASKSKIPGELLQIDHMSVKIDSGKEVKHFEAVCPITRFLVGKAHRNATSTTASTFLDFVQKQLPFPLISIQVDGGSEFMGDFEKACKDRNIPLFVLPPRMPKMNAFVERGNGTVKYEFYKLYDKQNNLDSINCYLQKYAHFYNTFRPHRGLQERTSLEYYQSTWRQKESHML